MPSDGPQDAVTQNSKQCECSGHVELSNRIHVYRIVPLFLYVVVSRYTLARPLRVPILDTKVFSNRCV